MTCECVAFAAELVAVGAAAETVVVAVVKVAVSRCVAWYGVSVRL